MSKIDLLSREWNEMVFEHRNKDYGAYVIRRDAGRRYARVLLWFLGVLLALLLFAAALGFFLYGRVKQNITALERELAELKPKEEEKEFKTKRLSRGRRAKQGVAPKASVAAPEVDENIRQSVVFGIASPDNANITFDEQLEDLDVKHNNEKKDLPVEGAQLVQTDEVEELPQYPGGLTAFRQYLDKEVNYSLSARRRSIQGEVIASFVILEDGSATEVKIEKSLDLSLDRSVLNALSHMPRWQPGKRGGKACPVKLTIPVVFTL